MKSFVNQRKKAGLAERRAFLLAIGMAATVPCLAQQPPSISTQPQSCTNLAGMTATFTVVATGTEPLAYQWQKYLTAWSDLADRTNTTLVLTNVQTSDEADYRVAVTNVDGATNSAPAHLYVITPPRITKVTNYNASVSLGAPVKMQVWATGTAPLSYQWWFGSLALAGKTSAILNLTNVQTTDAGLYTVVVTNWAGSASTNASLDVDPTFTKLTGGPVKNASGYPWSVSWTDFDGDGFLDLYLPNWTGTRCDLWRNNRDGSFSQVAAPQALVRERSQAMASAWGDYDNDGLTDVLVANLGRNFLFHNDGNGAFTKMTNGPITADLENSTAALWWDYDNDGFLDLFVANLGPGDPYSTPPGRNSLYHNNGDGSFLKVTNGIVVTDAQPSFDCYAADFDNDGDVDLYVAETIVSVDLQQHSVYWNQGDGSFVKEPAASGQFRGNRAISMAWGDYDNDGWLDLFLAHCRNFDNSLYHNNGDGTFTRITTGAIVHDGGVSYGCAWADYDNDGWLDLFVANGWTYESQKNFLYHNNGDGAFTRVTSGSVANDQFGSTACAWGDLDNDGFLDLFVANTESENSFYRNNGKTNNWLKVRCVGTVSNRSGIGAKARVKATVGGRSIWQLRHIPGESVLGGPSLIAHFGLSDATNVDVLRIEWPSGIMQELHNVPVKQYLTVTEPTRLQMAQPGQLQIQCWKGMSYSIECSSNLTGWTPMATVTNVTGALQWTDPDASGQSTRFYRVLKQ